MKRPHVKPIPDGYHTLTPHLVFEDSAKAIEFYKKAFGAQELARMPGPGGKLMHAEIKIGDAILMMADWMPGSPHQTAAKLGGSPMSLMIYTEDADTLFQRAQQAGATVEMPLMDMFWGDRYGTLRDPFGISWAVATHIEDVPMDEMGKRAAEFMKQMAQQQQQQQ